MIRRITSALTKALQIGGICLSLLAIPAVSDAAFITFNVGTTNAVPGDILYAFVFSTPVLPELYSTAAATAELTVTSAPGSTATVTIGDTYPFYLSGYGTVSTSSGLATNLGVDLGTTTCTSTNAVPTICNFGFTTNTFAPTLFDGLEALLTYNQTGVNSTAAWTGRMDMETELATVPEPASMLLLATGLAAAGLRRWRQKRA